MALIRREFLKQSLAASCAAIASTSLGAAAPSAAAAGMPLTVMFYGGAMPAVQTDLSKRVKLIVYKAGQDSTKKGELEDNVIGLEQLKDTNLWIGSGNKRNFPGKTQLQHFHEYLGAGLPFVGYRAA